VPVVGAALDRCIGAVGPADAAEEGDEDAGEEEAAEEAVVVARWVRLVRSAVARTAARTAVAVNALVVTDRRRQPRPKQ
jgi:hypothetical protein